MQKFSANKNYLLDYDSSQHSKFGFEVDATSIHGGVMQGDKITQSGFRLNADTLLAEIVNCLEDSPLTLRMSNYTIQPAYMIIIGTITLLKNC